MSASPTLILASSSPRRRLLLERLKVPFEVVVANVDERPYNDEGPVEMALRIAKAKAQAIAARIADGIVLAADTVVMADGRALGKPVDKIEAREMLRSLRGRAHQVVTGVTIINRSNGQLRQSAVVTRVWMRDYTEAEIDDYVASGDPLDKAGGYGIQNQHMHPVARIEGCFYNVVGLPLCEVIEGLKDVGFPPDSLPTDSICLHNQMIDGTEA